MAMWEPWRGCHRYSAGCKYCYIHKGDARRGVDTELVVKTEKYDAPIAVNKKGEYRMKPEQTVYVCFSSDFLIEDADEWRAGCFEMMRRRQDLHFIFLTKRIERFERCAPADWGDGYDNVEIGCTIENQETADKRLEIFSKLPIKHKDVICQPLIEGIDIEKRLSGCELVVVGGESDKFARPLDYAWVLSLREQALRAGVPHFQFRQCGTHFIKDGESFTLNVRQLCSQAKKAGIDY